MQTHRGLSEALEYPLFSAIFNRRSRRIGKGIGSVHAQSLSYTSKSLPQPLDAVEEALLIASTGVTGVTFPDMPLQTPEGRPLVGSPMLQIQGRAAGSPDNAQGTRFFLINDTGTYFLRHLEQADPLLVTQGLDADRLVQLAEKCKVKVLDRRLDLAREYPAYLGRNRYVSNLPGSTILVPVVDMTRQYINGIMFLLSQEEGRRPAFIDDWNFYRYAGVKQWVRSGFLNKDLPLPLGYLGTFRIHMEADFLLQNLMLAIQAMGLGGWIHAGFASPYLLGDPEVRAQYGAGLGFRYQQPDRRLRQWLRFLFPLPSWRPNPVGLDGVFETCTPPYHKSVSAAVDAVVDHKYGPSGIYRRPETLAQVFKPGLGERFMKEAAGYREEIVQITKDVCGYIHDTYGRFPAHVDAVFVPGIWIQAHHLDLDYYDQLYQNAYTGTQAGHQQAWHPGQREA